MPVLLFRIHLGGHGFESLSGIGYTEVFCGSSSSEISICTKPITSINTKTMRNLLHKFKFKFSKTQKVF